jgi:uncharacterized membrane protein YqhA
LIASTSIALFSTFTSTTVPLVMIAIIFCGGVFRALQFTSVNTLGFADVEEHEMSHATALSQMAQRIAQSIGVASAAILLQAFGNESSGLTNQAFSFAFLCIALISALSCLSFLKLPTTAGDTLAGRGK